jgi:GTP cyclohydrolase I
MLKNELLKDEKIEKIAYHFSMIMEALGLDLKDESLKKTPNRVAKMYIEEVFTGLDPSTFPIITPMDIEDSDESSSIVFVKCEFCTFCEHHFSPTYGTAAVAYIPNGKVIGLSKIPDIVRFYSQRPQVQERLTLQIAECIKEYTGTNHVAVCLEAKHFCMIARDPNCRNSNVITHQLFGDFKDNPNTRQSFFEYLK